MIHQLPIIWQYAKFKLVSMMKPQKIAISYFNKKKTINQSSMILTNLKVSVYFVQVKLKNLSNAITTLTKSNLMLCYQIQVPSPPLTVQNSYSRNKNMKRGNLSSPILIFLSRKQSTSLMTLNLNSRFLKALKVYLSSSQQSKICQTIKI